MTENLDLSHYSPTPHPPPPPNPSLVVRQPIALNPPPIAYSMAGGYNGKYRKIPQWDWLRTFFSTVDGRRLGGCRDWSKQLVVYLNFLSVVCQCSAPWPGRLRWLCTSRHVGHRVHQGISRYLRFHQKSLYHFGQMRCSDSQRLLSLKQTKSSVTDFFPLNLNKVFVDLSVYAPPPPSLVVAYYLLHTGKRTIFSHDDLLCSGTCSVTGDV